jgi:hypothetical protein
MIEKSSAELASIARPLILAEAVLSGEYGDAGPMSYDELQAAAQQAAASGDAVRALVPYAPRRTYQVLKGDRRSRAVYAAQLLSAGSQYGIVDWSDRDIAAARAMELSAEVAERHLLELPPQHQRAVLLAAMDACRSELVRTARRRAAGSQDPTAPTPPPHQMLRKCPWARRVIATAVIAWRCSIIAKRLGFSRLLTGRSRQQFCSLFRLSRVEQRRSATVYGEHPRYSTFMARVAAPLERAGFWYIEQPPADCCDQSLVGKRISLRRLADGSVESRVERHAVNHYWIRPLHALTADELAELDETLDLTVGRTEARDPDLHVRRSLRAALPPSSVAITDAPELAGSSWPEGAARPSSVAADAAGGAVERPPDRPT